MIEEIQLRADQGMCKAPEDMGLLEVGAFAGESTAIFLKHFKGVWAVDPWENGVGDITNNCNMENVYNFGFLKMLMKFNSMPNYSRMKFNEFCKKYTWLCFDIIYIDALHDYESVKKDIELAKKMLVPGGIIAGHDYSDDRFPGVVQAVHELLGGPEVVTPDMSWFKIIK